jgi:integrase/recombinase XerC
VTESGGLIPKWRNLPSQPQAAARELLKSFFDGRRATTHRTYRQGLECFAQFLGQPTPEFASAVLFAQKPAGANKMALDWKNWMVGEKYAAATVNNRLAALRALVKMGKILGLVGWEIEIKGLRDDPYRDTKGPGLQSVIDQIQVLRERRDPKGARDALILALMAIMGLRRGEVVSLNLEDYEEGRLFVMGKGKSTEEPLTVPPQVQELIKAWVKKRGGAPGPLFFNFARHRMNFERLSDRSVGRITNGLDLGHAHGLRHSAITQALDDNNGDVRKVARFSRHKNLQTLIKYDDNRTDLGGEISKGLADKL